MAALLKPFQVLSPRRQVPVGKLAIDWTHPLTNGLMGCWVPGVSEGLDLTGNFPTLTSTAVTSGPISGTSAEGPTFGDAFTNKYGNLKGQAPPRFKNATQVSVYWRGVLGPVLPSVYVYLVYCAYDTGVNSPYDVWAMGDISFTSMGSVGLGWNSGGNEVKSPSTISLTGAHRQISLLGTTKVGGNATLYSNGQQAFQNTFAASLPASSATSEFNISGWAGANRQAGVGTSVTYVWDRELSAAEAAQIDADPYAFLVPAYQESLPAIATTAGGTTYPLSAATGTFTVTGNTATLVYNRKLAGTTRAIVITGNAASLTYNPAAGGHYTLAGTTQTYTVSGTAATLAFNRKLPGTTRSVVITGNAATLVRARNLTGTTRSVVVTGNNATFIYNRRLTGTTASIIITGNGATLVKQGASFKNPFALFVGP